MSADSKQKGTKRKADEAAAPAAASATAAAPARDVDGDHKMIAAGGGGGGGGGGGSDDDFGRRLVDSFVFRYDSNGEMTIDVKDCFDEKKNLPISRAGCVSFLRWKKALPSDMLDDVIKIMDGYAQIVSRGETLTVQAARRFHGWAVDIEDLGTLADGNRVIGIPDDYKSAGEHAMDQCLMAVFEADWNDDGSKIVGKEITIRVDDANLPPFFLEADFLVDSLRKGKSYKVKARGRHGNPVRADPAAFFATFSPPRTVRFRNTAQPAVWCDVVLPDYLFE